MTRRSIANQKKKASEIAQKPYVQKLTAYDSALMGAISDIRHCFTGFSVVDKYLRI